MYAYETKRSFQPDIKGFDNDLTEFFCHRIFKGKKTFRFSEDDNSAVWDDIIKLNEVST